MFKKMSNLEMQSIKGGTDVTYTGSGSVHTSEPNGETTSVYVSTEQE